MLVDPLLGEGERSGVGRVLRVVGGLGARGERLLLQAAPPVGAPAPPGAPPARPGPGGARPGGSPAPRGPPAPVGGLVGPDLDEVAAVLDVERFAHWASLVRMIRRADAARCPSYQRDISSIATQEAQQLTSSTARPGAQPQRSTIHAKAVGEAALTTRIGVAIAPSTAP